jgi:hypothetical protein
MKDKQAKKFTMKDLMTTHQNKDIKEVQNDRITNELKEENYDEAFNEALKVYNQSITTLDPDYTNLYPIRDVLLRVFVNEPEVTESGLIISQKEIVPIPTRNGQASWAEVESPYPYSTKAIVVAVNKNSELVPGDIVYLQNRQVQAAVIGTSNEATITIKNAFVHPDLKAQIPPKDPSNKHYGYLLLPEYDIKIKTRS